MAAGGHQAEPGPAAPGSTGAPSLLSEVVFRRLRGLLYDKSGLRFDTTRKLLLTSRVRRRLQATGIGSAEAYVERLSTDPGELLALLDEVTTHETSFFRHRAQMEVFRRRVLPEVIARQRERGTRRLRMWSAACSSGEEPYTLAMIAREVLGRF